MRFPMRNVFILLMVVLVGLVAYAAAGPYLAIQGIRDAIAEQDTGKLEQHVDFPALRVNLRAQFEDYLARRAGPGVQSNLLGAFALSVANNVVGRGVDTMVTPIGIGAVLQGRSMWKQAIGETIGGDTYAPAVPADPLRVAVLKYDSMSRFTATIRDEDNQPVVFVLSRQGLRWRLTDIRLPLIATADAVAPAP